MSIITIEELAASKGPLLGIDPGTKTFGLAVSDTTRLIATPCRNHPPQEIHA